MRVLNIEDDTFKHNDICKALSGCGIKDVEWSNNLADGWKEIKNSIDSNNPYDLIITDMYYPGEPGITTLRFISIIRPQDYLQASAYPPPSFFPCYNKHNHIFPGI